MEKLKNKNRILVLILSVLIIFGNFTEVYATETFGLSGPEDLDFGCVNTYNNLLYVSGIIADIDPAFLKIIMCKESKGVPQISPNSNGTFDAGIMQINDVSGQGYSKEERNKNAALNVWLSTQVIKGKLANIKNGDFVGDSKYGETVKEDAFSILWFYNGYSSGKNLPTYVIPTNDEYIQNTQLSTIKRGLSTNSNYKSVSASIMLPPQSLVEIGTTKYIDFYTKLNGNYGKYTGIKFEDEDYSDMSIPTANRYGGILGNALGTASWVKETPEFSDVDTDTEYSTTVTGTSEYNQKLDYSSYKITRAVIKAIFTLISILVYGLIILMVTTWVLYLFYFLGVFQVNKIMKKITRGKLDCSDEDIVKELLIVTAFVAVSIALIITGFLQSIVTHITLWIMTIT